MIAVLSGHHGPLLFDVVFPISEVMRPSPLNLVPMAIMLWPSNEKWFFFPNSAQYAAWNDLRRSVLVRARSALARRVFDLSRGLFPAALPNIFTGLCGMGVAWVALIAAE